MRERGMCDCGREPSIPFRNWGGAGRVARWEGNNNVDAPSSSLGVWASRRQDRKTDALERVGRGGRSVVGNTTVSCAYHGRGGGSL